MPEAAPLVAPDAAPDATTPDATTPGVLATDLDGTVVDVNTFPHFVRFLTRRLVAARRPVALALLVGTGALRRAHVVGHHALKRVVCDLGATLPAQDVAAWAATMLDEHGHPEVVDLVRGWEGRILLTSAAPQVYADHLGALLGADEVHGSEVRGTGRGRRLVNNEGPAKAVRMRAGGLDRVDLFLTDDLVIDGPVAALADRVLHVEAGGGVRVVDVRPAG